MPAHPGLVSQLRSLAMDNATQTSIATPTTSTGETVVQRVSIQTAQGRAHSAIRATEAARASLIAQRLVMMAGIAIRAVTHSVVPMKPQHSAL